MEPRRSGQDRLEVGMPLSCRGLKIGRLWLGGTAYSLIDFVFGCCAHTYTSFSLDETLTSGAYVLGPLCFHLKSFYCYKKKKKFVMLEKKEDPSRSSGSVLREYHDNWKHGVMLLSTVCSMCTAFRRDCDILLMHMSVHSAITQVDSRNF